MSDILQRKYSEDLCNLNPLCADKRGCTDIFECDKCESQITYYIVTKAIDYSYCPYCGRKVKNE